MKIVSDFIRSHSESFLLIFLLALSAVFFSLNMLHYPYYENDEGTYMSQAWSILTLRKLAPYTYWHDHAPAGWILISIWEFVSGGFFQFGFSINSGRVLMLVLHLVITFLIYKIAKKVSGSKIASMVSALIFIFSPLGLTFERRVLLDNIMIFWLLISYYLVLGVGSTKHLTHYILSAVLFGIAVLSKESAIFFLPSILFSVYKNSHSSHRIFAVWKWLSVSFLVISLYFLYALLKGEFFQTGTFLGGVAQHVSVLDSFHYQLSRPGGFFLNPTSSFMLNFAEWINGGFFIPVPDPVIIIGGIIATVILTIMSWRDRRLLLVTLPCLSYWLFLIRGGEIIGFYIIPLIPFLALSIGLSINSLSELISNRLQIPNMKYVVLIILIFPFMGYYATHIEVYQIDQTTPQTKALTWISNNIPKNSNLIIDNYAYIEFHDNNLSNDYRLPTSAHYYWKAEKDPDINMRLFNGKWQKVDYILSTPQLQYDAQFAGLPLVRNAFNNSVSIQTFQGNKWNVEVRKLVKGEDMILSDMWTLYKHTFITSEGQVIDPSTNKTTSEGQSYALLRAVLSNDRTSFYKVLNWTKGHLLLKDKNLFGWWYGKNAKGSMVLLDKGTATDADQDIALALLLANEKWDDPQLLKLSKIIIADIWKYDTVEVAGNRIVVAGNWTSDPNQAVFTINPSYLSPYTYRLFSIIDNKHDWMSLVDSSYKILDACSSASLGVKNSTFLPPNWCNMTQNGIVINAGNISLDSSNYSYDAIRVLWRISQDYLYSKEKRALNYLKKINVFTSDWNSKKRISASYSHDGKNLDNTESTIAYSTLLPYFKVVNPIIGKEIFEKKISSQQNEYNGLIFWGSKDDYYSQNWIWLGMKLYTDPVLDIPKVNTLRK